MIEEQQRVWPALGRTGTFSGGNYFRPRPKPDKSLGCREAAWDLGVKTPPGSVPGLSPRMNHQSSGPWS